MLFRSLDLATVAVYSEADEESLHVRHADESVCIGRAPARESYLNVGGGAAFSLSDSIDLFGGFTTTVWGRNTHAVNRGLSLGMAWGFGRAGAPAATVAARRESALIKCLCQKAS